MDIFQFYLNNKVNYSKNSLQMQMPNTSEVDVSIIIPVMNRESFNKPLTEHLLAAINKHNTKSFSITFVEHSVTKKHDKLCAANVNHIWAPSNGGVFNKCYAFNLGALFSNKCKYFLFHDIDIIMQSDFFDKLFQNLEAYKTAIQPFTGGSLIFMDDNTTKGILNKSTNVNDISIDLSKVTPAAPMAPGGSICVEYNNFFKSGGFDAEFFYGYSCEDVFFKNKTRIISGINTSNSPIIPLFHMYHPPLVSTNKDIKFHHAILDTFNNLPDSEKYRLMELESDNLKKYIDHV
jgi:GT2 family glycosyltransferase